MKWRYMSRAKANYLQLSAINEMEQEKNKFNEEVIFNVHDLDNTGDYLTTTKRKTIDKVMNKMYRRKLRDAVDRWRTKGDA